MSREVGSLGALAFGPLSERSNAMAERLVDVLKKGQSLLHTFPVKVGNQAEAPDDEALAKGSEAAAYSGLVPEHEHAELTMRLHVDRGGGVCPPGDPLPIAAETGEHLRQCVRESAYRLWEADGRPDGRADEYWHCAYDQHIRERAYRLWKHEGCPEGRADEYWRRTVEFERE